MNSSRPREGQRITLYIGPAISLVLAMLHIMQTIVNDPTRAFSEEIISKLEAPRNTEVQPSDHHSSYYFFFRSKRHTDHHGADWQRLLKKSPDGRLAQESLRLFRPSIWPYDGIIETPPPFNGQGGRFPGESAVVTDYGNDVIVDIENFMEMDPQAETVVPIQRDEMTSYVTCRFMDYQYSFYFPHFAQQIFRCWSFFRANRDKSPVFVTSRNEYAWNLAMEKEFNRGLLRALEHAGINVVNASDTTHSGSKDAWSISGWTKGPILQPTGNHFQMASIDDMASFRQNLMASQNLTNIPTSFCGHSSRFPRIVVLTRRHSRRIKNSKEMAISLQQHYNLTSRIPVIYFEDAPFRNQVAVMGSTDILITPHGAQATGVAFMPKCGGVLELLPDGYFFPRFYGTLASTAGIEHAYIHLAKNASSAVVDVKLRDVGFLYPSFRTIQEGVDLLLERWRRCCHDAARMESS